MIKRLFAITLIAYILLHVSLSEPYAGRRQPTQEEYQKFMPIVRDWLTIHWDKKKEYGHEEFIKQKITSYEYCCIDDDGEKHIHIVDIEFHATWYEHGVVMEDKDMTQRLLFRCKDSKIIDYDPMPAYRIEEVG